MNIGRSGPRENTAHGALTGTYYPWFDWLRALCACMVMLHHDRVVQWEHAGGFAVQVFFALSGWLIGGMLLKLERCDLPRFFFNRAIRIWAPYYLAAAMLLTLSVLREPVTAKWVEIVIYKLTFVYNLFGTPQLAEYRDAMPQKGTLSHFWSVNAEEQFYLVAPLLLVLGAKYLGRTPLLWGVLALLAWVTNTYASIAFGVLAAVFVYRYGNLHLTRPGRLLIGAVLLLSVAGLVSGRDYAGIAPFAGLAIVLLLAIPAPQHSMGALFGGMSYPLYLNHWIGAFAFNFLMPGMRDTPLRQALSAVANIGFAMVLYWWIDRRLLTHRGNWFTTRLGWCVMVGAYAMVALGICYGLFMRNV
jgi:peptidoglycan/LPS O-acetylase OafA/YrhL